MRRRTEGEAKASSIQPASKALPKKQTAAPNKAPLFNASKEIRGIIDGLANRVNHGDLTDKTISILRQDCPGWDLQSLHQLYRDWLAEDPTRTPANYQNAFIGWVRKYDAKHRHTLRG